MKKHFIYIIISFLTFSCLSLKKNQGKIYTEKELESSILAGDFSFVGDTVGNSYTKNQVVAKKEITFNPNINKDSLFQVVIKKVHPSRVDEITKAYKEGSKMSKEFFLMLFSMPQSSKKELIANLENNENNIQNLISEYSELVPDNYVVMIEFNPEDVIISKKKDIDLQIYSNGKSKRGEIDLEFEGRNLAYDSPILLEQIKSLGWSQKTIVYIKSLLDRANCISIKNGELTTVGFARSGMGKYSYKFFKNNLSKEQQTQYDDKCYSIYYDRNIVLQYGSGAFGQECFEK